MQVIFLMTFSLKYHNFWMMHQTLRDWIQFYETSIFENSEKLILNLFKILLQISLH